MSHPRVKPSKIRGKPPFCPVCRTKLSGYVEVGAGGHVPAPGDLTICIYCATPLLYESKNRLRALHPHETAQANQNPKFQEALAVCRAAKKANIQ